MMRKNYLLIVLSLALFLNSSWSVCFCQKYKQMHLDSALEANSEKWKVKENNKMFGGIHKPEFGPYIITDAEKLDSPVIKKRTRNGSEFELKLGYDAEIETGHAADIDMRKKTTIQKTKFYRLQLAKNPDTTEALFSIFSTTVEKKQTVLGSMISKKDNTKEEVLSYSINVHGLIMTNAGSLQWIFFYSNNTYGSNNDFGKDSVQTTPAISGYLKNKDDSLHIEIIADTTTITYKEMFSSKHDSITIRKNRGIALVNKNGEQLAALEFTGTDGKRYIWINKDLESSYLQAITTLLAVIIAI